VTGWVPVTYMNFTEIRAAIHFVHFFQKRFLGIHGRPRDVGQEAFLEKKLSNRNMSF
jgi:hypothetical protein